MAYRLKGKRVWIAGHGGMVGSALACRLAREGCEVLTIERARLDLTRQADVEDYVGQTRPDGVIVAAARVGGIAANADRPVAFLAENLQIATNIVAASHACGVERLLYLGSSCIYPRNAPQPIAESALLEGALEPTNQWYAIAKIAGLKLVQAYRREFGRDYIAALPTNLYGPGDNFDLDTGHVLPALIHRAHLAKKSGHPALTVWGSGRPMREFLHVNDCADALTLLFRRWSDDAPVNIGSNQEIAIAELARLVCETVGYDGDIRFDPSRPDGTPRKRLDTAKLDALGWRPSIGLADGIADTYRWFLDHHDLGRAA